MSKNTAFGEGEQNIGVSADLFWQCPQLLVAQRLILQAYSRLTVGYFLNFPCIPGV
jgi:hypothetical protein